MMVIAFFLFLLIATAGGYLTFLCNFLLKSYLSSFFCLSLFVSLPLFLFLYNLPFLPLHFSHTHRDNNSHTLYVSLIDTNNNIHIINTKHLSLLQAIQSCPPLSSLTNRNRSTVFTPKKKNIQNIPNVLLYVTSDNFGKLAHLTLCRILFHVMSRFLLKCFKFDCD